MNRKLVIIIPAYNEKDDIEHVIKRLPKSITSIDTIEVVVVNDGSTDNTLDIVSQSGIQHIISFDSNKGLGEAFKAGLAYALKINADIIVNIDADAQYLESDIEKILDPVIHGKASMAIGDRQLRTITGYPYLKLVTQDIGNKLVNSFFRINATDATSGFRAFNRETASMLQNKLKNKYTYTIESLGILAKHQLPVLFVPIEIRYPTRETRLVKSKLYYASNFFMTLLKCSLSKC